MPDIHPHTETPQHAHEAPWTGMREVLGMSLPIVLGFLSHTLMQFVDGVMVGKLGKTEFAAVGSAGLWAYICGCFLFGVVGCVATFASQRLGRGEARMCGNYAWQGIYLSLAAGALSLILWPLSDPLFRLMHHSPEVTHFEVIFFRIRLLSYVWIAWSTALAAFFQSVRRPGVATWAAIIANVVNLVLNYVLIFGRFGFPEMGVAGSATATAIAMFVQVAILQYLFMRPAMRRQFGTDDWRFDWVRLRELMRIGFPSGFSMFMDVANWGIFTSFIVGGFGEVQLAAHNATMNFVMLCFMPAAAMSQAITAIVGNWIGKNQIATAKARTYTAMRICMVYMTCMGLLFAVAGPWMISRFFVADPEVVALGRKLLVLSAIFQAFDAINIISMGGLRGAGDTKWMAIILTLGAYGVFLPLAWGLALPVGLGALGAWIGATIYIILISGVLFSRFHNEKWRHIRIFEPQHENTGV